MVCIIVIFWIFTGLPASRTPALRAFTDTTLQEMKDGFMVSGRVREGMEWGREGEREGM